MPHMWGMIESERRRFERRFDRIERIMPASAGRGLRWLRDPSTRWLRIPVGVLLVIGGLLSFLPVLGIWMLPLGVMLLAQDIHVLKRPTSGFLIRGERRWTSWRRRRRRGTGTVRS